MQDSNIFAPNVFSAALYEKLQHVNPGITDMEPYEFGYALNNLVPEAGWAAVQPENCETIEQRLNSRAFYDGIQIKPRQQDRIVLDENILQLTCMLLVGLATGEYSCEWINRHFYFDIRGFYFLHRTAYFTNEVLAHLGGKPLKSFEPMQKCFDAVTEIGYKEFKAANTEIDQFFTECLLKLVSVKGTPILLAIAGPTAAGKTEIVERLRGVFEKDGRHTTSIEMDHFLTDREDRETKGIFTQGKEALHFELLIQSLEAICQGKKITIPRYDFVFATSSHDLSGKLKPGCVPLEVEPADVVFIEGNFPFFYEETRRLIGIKAVYLTDDAVRMKRKWKRDIDYRKKYEPTYFRNRFFKDQFIMAELVYRPQMATCDLLVDTTGAALWASPEVGRLLLDEC